MSALIPMQWSGEEMRPLPSFARMADEAFVIGAVYRMVELEERSEVSHSHQFAWLKPAWQSLPDDLKAEYPSPEHLRKRALIRTGWCTVQDYPCGSRSEAARWAINLKRESDEYTVVVPSESVVRVYRARSQARGAMNKADFQASKTDLMNWIADLIGVEPDTLGKQQEAA